MRLLHPLLQLLEIAVSKHGVKTMIDVPCGDVNWQFGSWETDSLQGYIGLDIVPQLITAAQHRFAHHSNKVFAEWDIIAHCPLPRIQLRGTTQSSSVDLVQLRDVLQHLSLEHATAAVRSVFIHGPQFILSTSYPKAGTNERWRAKGKDRNPNLDWRATKLDGDGAWTPYDMHEPPFDFPQPIMCLAAHGAAQTRSTHAFDETCLYHLNATFKDKWIKEHPEP